MTFVAGAGLPFLARFYEVVKGFDVAILSFLNGFSQKSWYVDSLVVFVDGNNIIKSGIIVALLWWQWFAQQDEEKRRAVREQILLTVIVAFAGIIVARFLAFALPFRVRPVEDAALKFIQPLSLTKHTYWSWSAFPSDHAVMFFAFAWSLRYISKKLGWFVFGYVTLLICLPRLYLGVHYPTDIIVGALIGIGMAWFAHLAPIRKFIDRLLIRPSMRWLERSPGTFYPCFFLLTYQIADMFDQVRSIGGTAYSFLKHIF